MKALIEGSHIGVRQRVIAYLVLWLIAAIAIQIFLKPEGLTETDLSPFQQRIRWPIYTPLMIALGLGRVITLPLLPLLHWSNEMLTFWIAFVGLAVIGIITLTRRSRQVFVVMLCVNAVLLAISVFFFLQIAAIPSGG